MSDLTIRLRTECSVYDVELCKEAADRIKELEAENERLRAALKDIFAALYESMSDAMQDAARAALKVIDDESTDCPASKD